MGHAYGHNLIAEVGAAAAVGLKAALENQTDLPVKITVLGTPAEECFGGKVELIEAGAFADIDLVFMAHPAQQDVSFLPGVAISAVTVKYLGKASHASAYPWEGVNALDAAVLAYNNLSVLRLQLRPEWRLHEIICSTHSHYNILPNATLAKLYEENGEALGIQFAEQTNPISASTDFGNVSFIVPGIHPCFYICTDAFNHTKEYTKAAGAEEAQLYTLRTAKALAMTAVDVVCSPDLLRQVREDFRLAKLKQDVRLKGSDAALRDSLTHLTLIISLEKGCKRYFITDEFVKVVLSLNSL